MKVLYNRTDTAKAKVEILKVSKGSLLELNIKR